MKLLKNQLNKILGKKDNKKRKPKFFCRYCNKAFSDITTAFNCPCPKNTEWKRTRQFNKVKIVDSYGMDSRRKNRK